MIERSRVANPVPDPLDPLEPLEPLDPRDSPRSLRLLRQIATHEATRRLLLLAAVLAGIWALAASQGWTDDIDIARVRSLVRDAGAWGMVVYVAVFAGGEFIHLPGMVFVLAAIAIWGKWLGAVMAFIAANVSVCASFVVVRAIGGKALSGIDNRHVQRAMAHLQRRPILTVAALRSVFWLAGPLNYVLALSRVSFVHYAVGSALGLVLPVGLMALIFERVLQWLTTT